jgi:hypothetical protein
MNAQILTLTSTSTQSESSEVYLGWLGTVKQDLEALQNACSAKLAIALGQGGTRGPWLNSVNESLTALLHGALAGAILAAEEET